VPKVVHRTKEYEQHSYHALLVITRFINSYAQFLHAKVSSFLRQLTSKSMIRASLTTGECGHDYDGELAS